MKYLIENRKQFYSWQERAVQIISLIHNEEEKLKCALLTLKVCTIDTFLLLTKNKIISNKTYLFQAAPVPWSNAITPLLKYGLSNHPLAATINFERKLEILKLVKVKYGWPVDSTGNDLMLVFRIIKTNSPDLFDDIKIVIESCKKLSLQANFYSTYNVAKHGEIERAFKYLLSLEAHDRDECCKMTINLLTTILDNAELCETESNNILEYWNLIVHNFSGFDKNDLEAIKNVLCLRKNFNLNLNLETLQNKNNIPAILKLGLEHVFDLMKVHQNDNYIEDIWQKVHFLTVLLNVDALDAVIEICKHIDDLHFSCCMTYMILHNHLNQNNTENILELAALLIAQQMNLKNNSTILEYGDPYVFPLIERLLSHAIRSKHNKIVYIEIFNFMQLVRIGSAFYDSNVLDNKLKYFQKISGATLNRYHDISNCGNSIIKNSVNQKNKRESMSVFDTAIEPSNNISSKIQKDPESVLNFVYCSIKMLLYVAKASCAPFDRIKNLMDINENSPNNIDEYDFVNL